ncbi:hypothetical protein ACP4OV_021640 [Aristida adscensionis]
MERREKQMVVGLTGRHVIRSGCSSSSPPPPAADCNRNESEGGDHKAALRKKKLKAKTLKWRSSNSDMNGKVEAGGSAGVYDDTVLSSLTTASFGSLISKKKLRTLGKVAEHCAVDPPVPRKLRSAINKRIGRIVSATSRHIKKRRHLSAISDQICFADQETRFSESSFVTEEEKLVADALLSLSQMPAPCELMDDKAVADISSINLASTSYSEGVTNEAEEIKVLPSATNELANQPTCLDQPVERTNSVPQENPVPVAINQPSNVNPHPPSSENDPKRDLSLRLVASLPSPPKDSSNNSARKQLKVQFDDNQIYQSQKPEAPIWLVNSDKSDNVKNERGKTNNNSAQETVPLVQTPLPCTPDGYLIRPSSSKLAAPTNTTSETCKVPGSGHHGKLSQVKHVSPTKSWKRSITHVYVSHVIQMHLNLEKASQNQAVAEESSRSRPSSSALHNNNANDETFYSGHFNVRPPVQASTDICNMTAGRQKMVSGGFLNLPTSSALPGAQHVQYLHPQIAPRNAMPYPFPHLPYTRGNLATAAALQQQMPQYMCTPGYGPVPRPGHPTSSAMIKLQQLIPTPQQQQQQMWQFHVPQYQARQDAVPPAAAWQHMSSLRPMSMLPPPAMPPPQMELLCAPYQGGVRQPQQLRLM